MFSRHFCRQAVRCLVALLFLSTAAALLHADVKTGAKEKRPKDKNDKKAQEFLPEAKDRVVSFVAGKSVDIEIEASVPTLKQAEFVIRQQPINGTLSAVRAHPRVTNKGIVTYTHFGVDAPLTDRFTFACRVGDGPISAPATISLIGMKFEPILAVQNITAMGKVFLGGESSLRFTVKNIGPAAFASDFTWEAPWHGPPHLELKAGELAELVVAFKPAAAGIFRLDTLLQPGQNTSRLLLYGECVRPLTISPGRLRLTLNSEGAREGTLILANGLNSPQQVDLNLPSRLSGVATAVVPGLGQIKLVLKLPPQDVAAFKDEVTIITGSAKEVVGVEADPKPSSLELVRPANGVLDLGDVPQGSEGRGEVVLRNNGGLSAVVQALKGASVQITPAGEAMRIEPGTEGKFVITLKGEQVGHLQTEAHIQGAGLLLRVPVKGNVIAPKEKELPSMASDGTALSSLTVPVEGGPSGSAPQEAPQPVVKSPIFKPMIAYLAATGLPVAYENINPHLERIREIEIRQRSSTSVTVAWNKPQVAPAGWIVEMASWARVPSGEVVKAWTPLKTWEPVDAGDHYVGARLNSLPPGSHIEVRLMGVDRDGKVSEPASFAMETTVPWRVPTWVWRAFAGIALAAALACLYQIREGYWDPGWKPLRALLRL